MGILGIILAIVGLSILIIGVFALVGAGTTASALGLGDAATTVLSGIGSFIASYWQVFAAFLAIGLIAYVARRGAGGGGLGFERAAGAAEGITKGLTSEGESSSVTSGPSSDPPTTTPTGGGDTDDSTSSSDSSTNVNVQQQQQQMQQLLQAIVMNNLSQTPAGTYAPQQQQQQQMIVGGSLSPNVYNTFLQQIQMTQVNQQQMINQLMQFIMQKGYDGVSDKVLVQFMKQVMDVDIDIDMGGKGDKINVQINQLIQKINIQRFEQNIEQIVQEISITNNQFVYIESLIEILIAIEEGAFVKEGDLIIIDAKKPVEIKATTLINFLEILQIVKTWELKQMMVALVEMEQASWEVRIEHLIVVYRESEGEKGSELTGENWEIFVHIFRQSSIDPSVKNIFIDLFEGRWEKYPINPMWVVNLWRHVDSMANQNVQDASQECVNYIIENKVRNVNEETFSALSQLLQRNWTLDDKYLKPSNNNLSNMTVDVDQIISNVESIAQQIQKDEQLANEMIQLEEEALDDLKDALQRLGTDHQLFEAIDLADQHGLQKAMNNGNAAKVGSILNTVEQEIGGGIRLDDPENLEKVINDLKQVHADLTEAHEDLKRADLDASKIADMDQQLEETIEQVDQHFVQEKEQELERIEQIFLGK